MHVALQRLDALDVRRLLGKKRIERVLALARGIDAALHADAVDQLVHAEGRGDDADRADDRARIGVDLIARAGEQIAAGRRDILGEHIDLEILLGGERADALIDQHRLHGRAAGRVDLDGDRLGAAHGEGLLDGRGAGGEGEARAERRDHADRAAEARAPGTIGARARPGGGEIALQGFDKSVHGSLTYSGIAPNQGAASRILCQ